MRTHSRYLTRAVFFSPPLGTPTDRTSAANRPARLLRVEATFKHFTQLPANRLLAAQPFCTLLTATVAVDPPDDEDEPQEAQFDDEETESVEERIEQNRDAGVVTNPPFRHQDEE